MPWSDTFYLLASGLCMIYLFVLLTRALKWALDRIVVIASLVTLAASAAFLYRLHHEDIHAAGTRTAAFTATTLEQATEWWRTTMRKEEL